MLLAPLGRAVALPRRAASRRDDIVRGFVKPQSRYIKRAPTHDCYQVYADHFRPVA